jgi:hypothetical protein
MTATTLLFLFASVAAEYAYLDTNHDGYVSSGEHEVYARALFDEMDGQPGDDKLTVAEIMAHEQTFVSHVFTTSNMLGPAEISTKEKIRRLDANQDGMVSQTEYTVGAAAWFQHRDLNNDGVLTLDEYDAGPEPAPSPAPAPEEPPPSDD